MTDDINGLIDQLLEERRPDRYEWGISDEWLEDIAKEISTGIPVKEAQTQHAMALVKRREKVKTTRTNKLLREVYESRQLPIDWMDAISLPLAVGKERVALRACTAEDFQQFAIDERRDASREFAARHETCDAAEWMANEMIRQGVTFGKEVSLDQEDAG